MAYTDLGTASEFSPADVRRVHSGCDGFYYQGTLSGTTVIGPTYPSICRLDPGGAGRDLTLDVIASNKGLFRRIINGADAAETLTCKNVAGDTIETIEQNTEAEFYCDGTSWVFVCKRTIALT